MKWFIFSLFLLFFVTLSAQEKAYKIAAIGFYNLENYFDTEDDPTINDEFFTPEGATNWNADLFAEKTTHLASVINELAHKTPDGIAVLGVAEVENKKVLEALVNHHLLAKKNYQIIHFDSPDHRGIDVALLYQSKYFQPTKSQALPLLIKDKTGERIFTRDILAVKGKMDSEEVHFLVNHWPSRRGGERASQPLRNAGALVCKNYADSVYLENPNAKIVIMGDLNDDPTSPSVKDILAAKKDKKKVKENGFYNPLYRFYKKGIGTLAYRDAWSLFDQIIFSENWIDKTEKGFQYYQAVVHNKPYLCQKDGQYKGYPFRTFVGSNYMGGYSDHFPVYAYLVKEK